VIADSGIVPAQTLFIDDGRKNVEAAQALGFAVYMPAPGEDFGHLFEEITATK
jgi:haloacid dehalogenase superfamily, subfamily IA, variant 3 with third motif having DD or ED